VPFDVASRGYGRVLANAVLVLLVLLVVTGLVWLGDRRLPRTRRQARTAPLPVA
jgi:hypothetical protein